MTPKSDYIFITRVDRPVTSLIVPAIAQYRSRDFLNGRVWAMGPKVTGLDLDDEVAYDKNCGQDVEVDQQKFIVIKYKQILAVR